MQFWQDLEGETLGGMYRLKKYVRGDGSSALFTTESNAENLGAADVRVFRTESESEEQLVARLEVARQITHPNLVRILNVDRAEIGTARVVIAATEHTEENLGDALAERPLTQDETREVVRSLGSAMRAIHGKNLVHGGIEPRNIFATAETIKLRSDLIVPIGTSIGDREAEGTYLPSEVRETGLTPAADIWSLGVLICQAFNQRRPSLDSTEEIERLPAPFGEIVRHCLETDAAERWSIEKITTALSAESAPAPRQATPLAEVHEPEPLPVSKPVLSPRETSQHHQDDFASAYPRRRPLPEKHRSIPASLYVGGVVFALVLASWLLLRPKAPKPAPSSVPAVTTAEPHVADPAPATTDNSQTSAATSQNTPGSNRKESPMRTVAPVRATGNGMPQNAAPAAAAKTPGTQTERPVWRVIAYAYGKAEDAQRRVEEIKAKHPELGPEVFSAEPDHGPYLVVLGGQMDKNEATRLKRQAVAEGMPRDTYAQNYSR